jgi:coenzyme F420 hydrogenase subunit beta
MTFQLQEIVESGLCIGCGLCQGLGGGKIELQLTPGGAERPVASMSLEASLLDKINAVCPGTAIAGLPESQLDAQSQIDAVWGPYQRIMQGYAGDPQIRFRGSTGGVMTALAIHLLESQAVDFILHVRASPKQPMRTIQQISRTRDDVLAGTGSRYGPAAALVDIQDLLERGERFALFAKPCDVGALRLLARQDPRVDQLCRFMISMVCGGASALGKSVHVLETFGLTEDELTLFRYRGFGNPGPTRMETKDGRSFEMTYNDMWAEESTWQIQSRCKICPDAIGESSDLAISDVWPGGGPTGEDAGFNGIIARSPRGAVLLQEALDAGVLVFDHEMSARDLDGVQPHQVRKKRAVWSRLAGMRAAGSPTPAVTGLRIAELAAENTLAENLTEARGTRDRVRLGKFKE